MAVQARADHTWLVVCAVLMTVVLGAGASIAVNGWPALAAASANLPADGAAAGTALVRIERQAATSPSAATVVALLDRHFTAINHHDYATWASTVTAERAAQQPRARWLNAYRSTADSVVDVVAIDTAPTGLLVSLTFVSKQNPADAPPDLRVRRICWKSHWPIGNVAAGGVLATPAPGATTRRSC